MNPVGQIADLKQDSAFRPLRLLGSHAVHKRDSFVGSSRGDLGGGTKRGNCRDAFPGGNQKKFKIKPIHRVKSQNACRRAFIGEMRKSQQNKHGRGSYGEIPSKTRRRFASKQPQRLLKII